MSVAFVDWQPYNSAQHAFWRASRALDQGDKHSVTSCLDFAFRLNPELKSTREWSRLNCKRRLGPAWRVVRARSSSAYAVEGLPTRPDLPASAISHKMPQTIHQILVSRDVGGAALIALNVADHIRRHGTQSHVWIPGEGRAWSKAKDLGFSPHQYDAAKAIGSRKLPAALANWRLSSRLRNSGGGLVHIHAPLFYGALSKGLAWARVRARGPCSPRRRHRWPPLGVPSAARTHRYLRPLSCRCREGEFARRRDDSGGGVTQRGRHRLDSHPATRKKHATESVPVSIVRYS